MLISAYIMNMITVEILQVNTKERTCFMVMHIML